MKNTSLIAPLFLSALAAASSPHQHQHRHVHHEQRDLKTKTEIVVVTDIVYVTADGPPPAAATSGGQFEEKPSAAEHTAEASPSKASPSSYQAATSAVIQPSYVAPSSSSSSVYVAPVVPPASSAYVPPPSSSAYVPPPASSAYVPPPASSVYTPPAVASSSTGYAAVPTTGTGGGSGGTHSGRISPIGPLSDPNTFGACQDQKYAMLDSTGNMYVAVNPPDGVLANWCGKKITISYNGATANAVIADQCSGCGGPGGLDLLTPVWNALNGGSYNNNGPGTWVVDS